jgi:hypothetical protein
MVGHPNTILLDDRRFNSIPQRISLKILSLPATNTPPKWGLNFLNLKSFQITFVALGEGQIDLSAADENDVRELFSAFKPYELVALIPRFEISVVDTKELRK